MSELYCTLAVAKDLWSLSWLCRKIETEALARA